MWSYQCAKALHLDGEWEQRLPGHEFKIIEAALQSPDHWKEFMEGSAQTTGANKTLEDSHSELAQSLAVRNNQIQFGDILNFRVREILGEALIEATSGNKNSYWTGDRSVEKANRLADMSEYPLLEVEDDIDKIAAFEDVPVYKLKLKNGNVPSPKRPDSHGAPTKKRKLDEVDFPTNFQRELNRHLYQVLEMLKEYPEHSDPFLRPVTDEEAEGYSRIILHPMDLQTMTEKIMQKEYLSVGQFKKDLNLIWKNCYEYNLPTSIFCLHARQMEKFAEKLVQTIPSADDIQHSLCTKIQQPFEPIEDDSEFRVNFYSGKKRRRTNSWVDEEIPIQEEEEPEETKIKEDETEADVKVKKEGETEGEGEKEGEKDIDMASKDGAEKEAENTAVVQEVKIEGTTEATPEEEVPSAPPKPFEYGGYVSELGEIKISEFQIPAPKVFTGACAIDEESTFLRLLREEASTKKKSQKTLGHILDACTSELDHAYTKKNKPNGTNSMLPSVDSTIIPEVSVGEISLLEAPVESVMFTPNSELLCQDVMEKAVASLISHAGFEGVESHHVLEVVTDLVIHFIQGIGEMTRREMDIPGHVGTRVEIERGAMFNSLDRVFGYGMCDVVEYALNFGSRSSPKLHQFATEAIGLLPAYNVDRIKRDDIHISTSISQSNGKKATGGRTLASSAGRTGEANWGRHEGGDMKKRWASQARARGQPYVPTPGQGLTGQGPAGPQHQAYGQRPGVFNVPGQMLPPGSAPGQHGQPGQLPNQGPQHLSQHPLLQYEEEALEAPPRHWTLYGKHFQFAKDWSANHENTELEAPPGGRERENFFYNNIIPGEESVLRAAKPLRKAMGIKTKTLGPKRAGTTNFTIGAGPSPLSSGLAATGPTLGTGLAQGILRPGIKVEPAPAAGIPQSPNPQNVLSPTPPGGFITGAQGVISTTIGPGSAATPGILGGHVMMGAQGQPQAQGQMPPGQPQGQGGQFAKWPQSRRTGAYAMDGTNQMGAPQRTQPPQQPTQQPQQPFMFQDIHQLQQQIQQQQQQITTGTSQLPTGAPQQHPQQMMQQHQHLLGQGQQQFSLMGPPQQHIQHPPPHQHQLPHQHMTPQGQMIQQMPNPQPPPPSATVQPGMPMQPHFPQHPGQPGAQQPPPFYTGPHQMGMGQPQAQPPPQPPQTSQPQMHMHQMGLSMQQHMQGQMQLPQSPNPQQMGHPQMTAQPPIQPQTHIQQQQPQPLQPTQQYLPFQQPAILETKQEHQQQPPASPHPEIQQPQNQIQLPAAALEMPKEESNEPKNESDYLAELLDQ